MSNVIKNIKPLGFPWVTQDPFLFCVFHEDAYPQGDGQLAPAASLEGRNLGQDFVYKDGWNMYHGAKLPGFPAHPHRGFETITLVNQGWVDHADSLGGEGRYADGDVQWMTAGKGLQHSEMFPLMHEAKENPLELFQIWLNLPSKNKLVQPHYKMLWSEAVPQLNEPGVEVKIIAGQLGELTALSPPPDSWAADDNNQVAILTIELEANCQWTLPACEAGINRSLYFYKGSQLNVAGEVLNNACAIELGHQPVLLSSGDQPVSLLLLQGRPINEPIAQMGPFVMNNDEELRQAVQDYQQDQFGGWSWTSKEPNHGVYVGRYARYLDGKDETP